MLFHYFFHLLLTLVYTVNYFYVFPVARWVADGFSKGRRGRTGRRTNGGALPGPRACRRLDRFQARAETPPTRDDNSCRGPRRRLRRPLGRRRLVRWLGWGISTRFPFVSRTRAHTASMFRSGSTHRRATAVDAEPLSTSAFQGLVRIVATTTKIYWTELIILHNQDEIGFDWLTSYFCKATPWKTHYFAGSRAFTLGPPGINYSEIGKDLVVGKTIMIWPSQAHTMYRHIRLFHLAFQGV